MTPDKKNNKDFTLIENVDHVKSTNDIKLPVEEFLSYEKKLKSQPRTLVELINLSTNVEEIKKDTIIFDEITFLKDNFTYYYLVREINVFAINDQGKTIENMNKK